MLQRVALVALIAILATPLSASAEVSDKAASIPMHWLIALPIAAVLFGMASIRWWLAVPLLCVPFFFLFSTFDLTSDPHVGQALWQEQGWPYFLSLWTSDIVMVAALGAGAWRDWSRRASPNRWPAA